MLLRSLAVVATVSVFAVPAYSTTAISGGVGVGVRAYVGDSDNTNSQSSALNPMSLGTIGATAQIGAGDDTFSSFAYGNVNATWNSADDGFVITNWGWDISTEGSPLRTGAFTNLTANNWTYTFTASRDGVFRGRYSVSHSGDPFGLQPLFGYDDFTGTYGGNIVDPDGAGAFSKALISGQTYKMSFGNFGNIYDDNLGFDTTANAFSRVDWKIAYVPEPATWAMMIIGFGAAGTMIRRRRAALV